MTTMNACDVISEAREFLDSYQLVILSKREFERITKIGIFDGVNYLLVGGDSGG